MKETMRGNWPVRQATAGPFVLLASTVAMLLRVGIGVLVLCTLMFCGTAQAKRVIGRPEPQVAEMHFALVKMSASDCGTDCAEWISAEGMIKPETALEFLAFLRSTGGRKLPVLINSNGGNISSALAIGRLLRQRHLDIAVTRTQFVGCNPTDDACRKSPTFSGYRGRPISKGAICASACAYLIAGAERRFVSTASLVGVHATSIVEPASTIKSSPASTGGDTDKGRHRRIREAVPRLVQLTDPVMIKASGDEIRRYMTEMGVSENVVAIAFATKASTIHWMTREELQETHLATDRHSGEVLLTLMPVVKDVVATPEKLSIDPPKQIASTSLATPGIATPATPNPAPPPIKSKSIAFSTVPIASIGQRDFETALTFTHQTDEPTVLWSAEIRANGVTLPLRLVQLSLQLDGQWFYAIPDRRDLLGSVLLHGEIALHDYCELARSSQARLRLAIPGPGGVGQREILSDAKSLDLAKSFWPECTAPATTLSQAPAL